MSFERKIVLIKIFGVKFIVTRNLFHVTFHIAIKFANSEDLTFYF